MNINIIGEAIGIIEAFEKDNHTYFRIGNNIERIVKFDNVYTKWMKTLYQLVAHIAEERDKRNIDISIMEEDSKYQFFGLAESVADQLMYFFVKDELSESNGNMELDSLCYQILFFKNNYFYGKYSELAYVQLKNYLKNLVMQDFNAFTSGQFYDFYVSYWSCFESCLNLICEPYEKNIIQKLNKSQFKEMNKFLKNLYGEKEYYEDIVEILNNKEESFYKSFGKYVSFPDKYNYLLKDVLKDKYTRDEKKDRAFLEFCGAARNTLHNNGIHLKTDKEVEVRGHIFKLEKGKKQFSDDYSKIFILAEELFDIYVAIVDGLTNQNM